MTSHSARRGFLAALSILLAASAHALATILMLVLLMPGSLQAQATLPEIFRDHMVLQRQMPVPVWGVSKPGAAVTVKLDKAQKSTTSDKDGHWKVELPAHPAGGPYTLSVTAGKKTVVFQDVLVGDVWLASGQSNMAMPMRPELPYAMGVTDYQQEIAAANEKNVRFYTVLDEADFPEQKEMHGDWIVSEGSSVCNVSAAAYYFARKVNQVTGIPIGMIVSAVGSTSISSWVETSINQKNDPAGVEATAKLLQDHAGKLKEYENDRPEYEKKAEENLKNNCTTGTTMPPHHDEPFDHFMFKPSALYNSMIAPLEQVPIKGVLWYQGEADTRTYPGYSDRMKEMIDSWRTHWHEPQMPFYFVQLEGAGPKRSPGKNSDAKNFFYAELREQQRLALAKIPHSGMALATDIGDPVSPHPRNKKAVGERLALLALANDYGLKVVSTGPMYQSFSRSGDHLSVHFETQGSPMLLKAGVRCSFEIAGPDGVFRPAMAKLDGDSVDLSSPLVNDPRNARYGWANNPDMCLYNAADLPAPPFTTEPQP
jgi:sialate O-acetylesterase